MIGKDCWNIIQTYHTQLKYNDVMKELKKTWCWFESDSWSWNGHNKNHSRLTNITNGDLIIYRINYRNNLIITKNMSRTEIELN